MREILKKFQKYYYYGLGGLLILAAGLGFFNKLPVFEPNYFQSGFYLATGFFFVQSARQSVGAMNFWGRVLGVVYVVIAILGSTLPEGDILGYMTAELPENILHALVSLPLLYYGFHPPEHKPVEDHDAEREAELEKELAAERAAIPEESRVRGNPIVDLKAMLARKEETARPAPEKATADIKRID